MASAEFELESRESNAETELMSLCLFLYAELNRFAPSAYLKFEPHYYIGICACNFQVGRKKKRWRFVSATAQGRTASLLQQLENVLLSRVGLRQSIKARLLQNVVLGQIRGD